jgi:hypothetical protein
MLENTQIIHEQGQAKFAVIDFQEYLSIKELLSNSKKLADYLDYLHIQEVKQKEANKPRKSLAQVKQEIGLDE